MWYSAGVWPRALAPLSWFYGRIAEGRRSKYADGKVDRWESPVPVCVVGNITAGGTGKTPLVVFLAQWLTDRGANVGLVSRGYGGRASYPLEVNNSTPVDLSGDEALLLVHRTGCPMVVDPDRVSAVRRLVEQFDLDVVLADDGLQHYALGRNIEVVVIDGQRGAGNGMLLPAGPLREPLTRLESMDWIVSNGRASGLSSEEWVMAIRTTELVNVASDERLPAVEFKEKFGTEFPAVAGIGNPNRFVETLEAMDFVVDLHVFGDHHAYRPKDLAVVGGSVFLTTEKDAQKIRKLESLAHKAWYVEIAAQFNERIDGHLEELFGAHGIDVGLPR